MHVPRLVLCLALIAPSLLSAQPIEERRVSFAPGATEANLSDEIQGSQIVDLLVGARAGQRMTIDFSPENPSAYFNLLQGNDPAALHIGSSAGNGYEGFLPASGDYRVRIYLMRNAARRGETSWYSIDIGITDTASLPSPDADYADGLAGGPDWWAVAGLGGGDTLNVRSGAGADTAVIGTLMNGDRVRNRGCRMNGSTRWCQIADPKGVSGWVAGRYLVEAAAPSTDVGATGATGQLPCALRLGQPMAQCSFRVSRGTGGTASVWVSLSDGSERYLDFREGRLIGTDPGLDARQETLGDLNLISIDGNRERYELPNAILYGG